MRSDEPPRDGLCRCVQPADQSGRIVPTTCSVPVTAADGEVPAAAGLRRGQRDRRGQEQRLPEADVEVDRVGQPTGERREDAGLHPHAVRDRPLETERLRGEPRQVDRVHVAGHLGVAPSGVVRDPPGGRDPFEVADGHLDAGLGAPSVPSPRARGRSTASARPPARPPTPSRAGRRSRRCGAGRSSPPRPPCPARRRTRSAAAARSGAHVHQARQRQRERAVAHQRHLQRERQQMRIGRRQDVVQRQPAHPGVGGEVGRVDRHAVAGEATSGSPRPDHAS